MIVLGLIETALELVPAELFTHPVVVNAAKIRGKTPPEILLDERLHLKALQTLPDAEKRGRPDVAHRSLLIALDSVLARAGQLDTFIHTYTGEIIEIKQGTRLPRRTPRFVGLMEQLLRNKRVPPSGDPLLQVIPETLETHLQKMKPSQTVLLSEKGSPMSATQLAKSLLNEANPVVLVGGFAHGSPKSDLTDLVDQRVSFDPETLPVSTIVGMLIHGVEQIMDLSARRFQESKKVG
jgi:rRNA small subunit pseudouridine methyltransferase Nep1